MKLYSNPFAGYDSDAVAWAIRSFYILAAYAILIVRFIPDLRDRFLAYGARSGEISKHDVKVSVLPRWVRVQFDPVLDWFAEVTVPHSWFTHFYLCSTACSAYWLYAHRNVIRHFSSDSQLRIYHTWELRTALAMFLLQVQGLRRLYECLVIAKASGSRMWIGHYVIGVAFYIVTNVAIWIEPALESRTSDRAFKYSGLDEIAIFNIARVIVCVAMFCYYSYKQYRVHQYLASLKEYRVPDHPIFEETNLVCPHYGFEVNLYLVLSILTARDTRIFNLTMSCATAFVIVNLGITADSTKKWQLQRFPKQRPQIAARKKMLGSIW